MPYEIDEILLLLKKPDPLFEPVPVTHQILRIAIYDEFRARAFYQRVVEMSGPVLPFRNILEAERNHVNALKRTMEKYRVPVPHDPWPDRLTIPPGLKECCEMGVAGEIENIAMYDNLLPYARENDIRDVFFRLQAASFNNHLPAFRRCVSTDAGAPQEGGLRFLEEILVGGGLLDREDWHNLSHMIQHASPMEAGMMVGKFINQFSRTNGRKS